MERLLKILIGVGLFLILEFALVLFILLNYTNKSFQNENTLHSQNNKRFELVTGHRPLSQPFYDDDDKRETVYLLDNQTGEVWRYDYIANLGTYMFIKSERD